MKNTELNDLEFSRLSEILESLSPSAMNVEMLDGFFTALICSPNVVMPNEYLPTILGDEDSAFDSQEQAMEFFNLTMRHWNFIADELLKSLNGKTFYKPILLEGENGIIEGSDWATGFMEGVAFDPESWSEVTDEDGGLLLPILILAHENDPDIESRPTAPLTPEAREEVIKHMIVGLVHIYKFFAPHRSHPTFETIKRTAPKVGRNDPCPCGSNRKYKHCCAMTQPTIH
jgi:uncharacterized protein